MDIEKLKKIYRLGFPEDREDYVDYFFKKKIKSAEVFCFEKDGRTLSCAYVFMRKLCVFNNETELPFLVGAATLPEFRGNKLFFNVMKDIFLRYKNFPFIALYPFKHEYYNKNFGFTNYYYAEKYQSIDTLKTAFKSYRRLNLKETADYSLLNEIYSGRAAVAKSYVVRDAAYFKAKVDEHAVDGGEVVLFFDDKGATAYAFVDKSGGIEEVCIKNETPDKEKTPAMMIRILNVEAALRLFKPKADVDTTIEVRDDFFDETKGMFSIKFKDGKCDILKLQKTRANAAKYVLDVRDLTNIMFDGAAFDKGEAYACLNALFGVNTFGLEKY
ncbi:MAG: GNAT family N-acetyltransferase [Clostridiales bacterium]|jgi:predicted acetyltransferase|nr:GNAT family N-acetyltransferase [Clostridiales bacterium]